MPLQVTWGPRAACLTPIYRDCGQHRSDQTDRNDGLCTAALRLRLDAADEAKIDSFKNAPRNNSASHIS